MAGYKPFKMKGHTLPGIKQRPSKKMADGRAGSSPFQNRITDLTGADDEQIAAANAHNDAHAAGKDPHGSPAKQGYRPTRDKEGKKIDYTDPEVLRKEKEGNQRIHDIRTGEYDKDKKRKNKPKKTKMAKRRKKK